MHRQPSKGTHMKHATVVDHQRVAGNGQSPENENIASSQPTEALTTTRLRQLFPTAWEMIRPYWSSEDRWAAWGLLVVVLVLTLAMVHMSVLINEWNNTFYTALQNKDRTVFLQQLVGLSWLVTLIVFFSVYQLYLSQMLGIRWRRAKQWITSPDPAYLRTKAGATG